MLCSPLPCSVYCHWQQGCVMVCYGSSVVLHQGEYDICADGFTFLPLGSTQDHIYMFTNTLIYLSFSSLGCSSKLHLNLQSVVGFMDVRYCSFCWPSDQFCPPPGLHFFVCSLVSCLQLWGLQGLECPLPPNFPYPQIFHTCTAIYCMLCLQFSRPFCHTMPPFL